MRVLYSSYAGGLVVDTFWSWFDLAVLPRPVWLALFLAGLAVVFWLALKHDKDTLR